MTPLETLLETIEATIEEMNDPDLQDLPRQMRRDLRGPEFSTPRLPNATESVAVALEQRKTAALLFDRIWSIPVSQDPAPTRFAWWGATESELAVVLLTSLQLFSIELSIRVRNRIRPLGWSQGWLGDSEPTRRLSDMLYRAYGFRAIPLYSDRADRDRDYREGDKAVLLGALNQLKLVDEAQLTWEQVAQFRQDNEARLAYKRMIRWLDTEMLGRNQTEVENEIAIRYDRYQWALRKHGIETWSGCLETLVDPTFLASLGVLGSAAAAAGFPTAGVGGAVVAVVGKIVLTLAKRSVARGDLGTGADSEVAFLHELQRKVGKAG